MTIGEFSRLVGVTPSALRYYDDCGLLVPAHTASHTGYRFYAEEQRDRATVIRLLREAGLSLAEVQRIVDGPAGDVRQVVCDHLMRTAQRADRAAAVLRQAAQTMLGDREPSAQVRVAGPELASGIRQVHHAVDRPRRREPVGGVLTSVQVEIDVDEVRLVASDRYRLALRSLRGHRFDGGVARTGVAADDLLRLVPALLLADMVGLRVEPTGLTCVIGDATRTLAGRSDRYPDFRSMLDAIPPADARVVLDRAAVLSALRAVPGDLVLLTAAAGGVVLVARPGSGDVRPVTGTWRGPRFGVVFDAAHLAEAVAVGVGPDVILELSDGPAPAVVRSADHGSFTTLVMPRAHPDHASDHVGLTRHGAQE
jgi:DNA-binding transcriptional MerR regulator